MKKILLLMISILLPTLSFGSSFFMLTGGSGGESRSTSYGIESGGEIQTGFDDEVIMFGAGISIAYSDDMPSMSGIFVPGTGIKALKEYNDGNEYEVYITFGDEFMPGLYAVGGVGYAMQQKGYVALTDHGYVQLKSETEDRGTLLFGIRYLKSHFTGSLGYDLRRGMTLGVGVSF